VVKPKACWVTNYEKELAINYYLKNHDKGYRTVAYEMIDKDIVYLKPSTLYRILKEAGVMRSRKVIRNKKGNGFRQPLRPHEHWHTDISYLKIKNTIYFFMCVLDGCSRTVLHWEVRERMKEHDVEMLLQRTLEKYPGAAPRLITDNGSQYTAKEFKHFITRTGLTHVRTSPYYPQSNGKIERFHYTYKSQCVWRQVFLDYEDAIKLTEKYINYYNNERLHSAIGYVPPIKKLNSEEEKIFTERKRKLKYAEELRKKNFMLKSA